MENIQIRGDRLLLALDVIQFLDQRDRHLPCVENPRRFRFSALSKRLCALEPNAETEQLFQMLGEVGIPLYPKLAYLRWFLRENQSVVEGINFDVTEMFKNRGRFLQTILRAIASGEITEAMLREPTKKTAK